MFGLLLILLGLTSCRSEEDEALREKIAAVECAGVEVPSVLTEAVIGEYQRAELAINRRYVREINNVIANDFQEKLDDFTDKEFGYFKKWEHLIKAIVLSREEWNDYWDLKKSKYFSNETTKQKLRDCYEAYVADVLSLRERITSSSQCKAIPKEVTYNLQKQDVFLSSVKQYIYMSVAIDYGVKHLIWFLVFGVVALISFLGLISTDIMKKKVRRILMWIVWPIIYCTLLVYNDSQAIKSIREQYKAEKVVDSKEVLSKLDESTGLFYEYISK